MSTLVVCESALALYTNAFSVWERDRKYSSNLLRELDDMSWKDRALLHREQCWLELVEDGLIRCPARNRGQIGGNWSPVDWINLVRPLATVNIGLIAQWTWVSGPTRQATLEESILEQMVGLASPCVPVGERGRSQGWKLPSFVCQPAVVAHNCFILYARGHSR